MKNVYIINTDIKVNGKPVTVNILDDTLADAISSASYLKYNGEEIKNRITSASIVCSNVIDSPWGVGDLNPSYKPKKEDEALSPKLD